MDMLFNILKALGAIGAIVTVVMVVARVWSGTARERLILNLEKELALANEHKDRADISVQHYRDEMHTVRNKCNDEISKLRESLDQSRQHSKEVELENAKLKSRPDLSQIEQLLGGQKEAMQGIERAMTGHIDSDAQIFKSIDESLSALPETLRSMSAGFDRRQQTFLKTFNRKNKAPKIPR